ncbi:MAG: M57 family metalloprotease [Bacteroidota bacterium]
MTKLRNALMIVLTIMASTVIMSSCQNDEELIANENNISPDIIEKFETLGFDASDIAYQPADEFAGIPANTNFLLEGDIVVTPEMMDKMMESDIDHHGAMGEQYRTYNLVNTPRTISVIGYTGGSNALTTKMRQGLYDALIRYNQLNTNINFTLQWSSSTNADIVVYRTSGGAGGSAGFPSGGAPYKWVQIFSGMDNYSRAVNSHVIAHEIGHTLGLRHTDYFDRSLSCGSGGNEGSAGVGAEHIPGTPTGFDPNSIMLSCFGSGSDGQFGQYDRTALEYLY